jgi:hypothetical protein
MVAMNNPEVWRPVVGWKNIYDVSNLGRIRRVLAAHGTHAGRVLKPWPATGGYLYVILQHRGRKAEIAVHRIVAASFLGRCPLRFDVNHKDGNRANPQLDNLEYLSRGDNHRHAYRILKRTVVSRTGETNGNSKLTQEQVAEIRRRYVRGKISQQSLAAEFQVNQTMIGFIIRRVNWAPKKLSIIP